MSACTCGTKLPCPEHGTRPAPGHRDSVLDERIIAQIIHIVSSYESAWGRYPTVVEVIAALQRPGEMNR